MSFFSSHSLRCLRIYDNSSVIFFHTYFLVSDVGSNNFVEVDAVNELGSCPVMIFLGMAASSEQILHNCFVFKSSCVVEEFLEVTRGTCALKIVLKKVMDQIMRISAQLHVCISFCHDQERLACLIYPLAVFWSCYNMGCFEIYAAVLNSIF